MGQQMNQPMNKKQNRTVSPETIKELQAQRKAKGYTIRALREEIEDYGEYVSPSTIRRVFEKGAEKHKFAFATIYPLIHVLLEVDDPTETDMSPAAADVLKENIKALHHQLDEQRAAYEKLLEDHRAEYARNILRVAEENKAQLALLQAQVEQLSMQISIKDQRIDKLMDKILEKEN